MKLVTAFTRPEALLPIKQALFAKDIFSMSVTNILGAGRQKGYTSLYRGVATEVNLLKKIRIEIAVDTEETAQMVAGIIMDAARTGKEGDGVILVSDVAHAWRIRTGEHL